MCIQLPHHFTATPSPATLAPFFPCPHSRSTSLLFSPSRFLPFISFPPPLSSLFPLLSSQVAKLYGALVSTDMFCDVFLRCAWISGRKDRILQINSWRTFIYARMLPSPSDTKIQMRSCAVSVHPACLTMCCSCSEMRCSPISQSFCLSSTCLSVHRSFNSYRL